MDRRNFLRLAGGAAGAAALAACGGSNDPAEDFVASRLFDSRALQPDGTPQRMVWAAQRNGSYVAHELADVVRVTAVQNDTTLFDGDVTTRRDGLVVPYLPVEMSFPSSDPVEFTFEGGGQKWTSFAAATGTGSEPIIRPGQAFPSVATPTFDDAAGVDPICTRRPDPCPFHDVSLDSALADGQPVVLLLSTPAFCANLIACGPVLDILINAEASLPTDAAVIHAEIYEAPTGRDPGPVSPAMAATGAWFEPLLYMIDGDGIVTDRLDFMWDTSELTELFATS